MNHEYVRDASEYLLFIMNHGKYQTVIYYDMKFFLLDLHAELYPIFLSFDILVY